MGSTALGNVKENRTLAGMLEALKALPGSRVVLHRGIAMAEQVHWLKENGYRYIVVSRERKRRFESEAAMAHRARGGRAVHLERHPSRRLLHSRISRRCSVL